MKRMNKILILLVLLFASIYSFADADDKLDTWYLDGTDLVVVKDLDTTRIDLSSLVQNLTEYFNLISNDMDDITDGTAYVKSSNNFNDSYKSKLDGIEAGAEANVQADWDESNSSADAYIQNKPTNLLTEDDTTSLLLTQSNQYWELEEDTLSPKDGIVRLDSFTMGSSAVYPGKNVSFGSNPVRLFNGTSTSSLTNVYDYVMSASGKYRYMIKLDDGDYNIIRSIDFGSTFPDTLSTLNTAYNSNKSKLTCSNDGGVVVYTDINTTAKVYISRDFGNSFTTVDLTGTSNFTNVDISDDGSLIVFGYGTTSYIYRSSLTDLSLSVNHIKVDNDSLIFYSLASSTDCEIYKRTASGTTSLLYTNDYGSGFLQTDIAYEDGSLFIADSLMIKQSEDEGSTWSTLNTISEGSTTFIWGLEASMDLKYVYITMYPTGNTHNLYVSSNYGVSFTDKSDLSGLDINSVNAGLSYYGVDASFSDGRMEFETGGIRMGSDYTPTFSKDVITKDYFEANGGTGGGSSGDMTEVNTEIGSGLAGGSTSGAANLKLDLSNISTQVTGLNSTNRFAISRGLGYTANAYIEFDDLVSEVGALSYTLPTASNTTLGGVKVSTSGGGLEMNGEYLVVRPYLSTTSTSPSLFDYISTTDVSNSNATRAVTIGDILDLAGSTSFNLTVKDADGTPTVPGVNTIEIEDATVTDQGGGIVRIQVPSSGGSTNLGVSTNSTSNTITSDTGTDAVLTAASATDAGLFLPAEKTKLDGIDESASSIYASGLSFNISTGELSITRNGASTLLEDLDGRFSVLGHTHTTSQITNLSSYTGFDSRYLQDAPSDGSDYVRKNGAWSVSSASGVGSSNDTEILYNNSGSVDGLSNLNINTAGGLNYGLASGEDNEFMFLKGKSAGGGGSSSMDGGILINGSLDNTIGSSQISSVTYNLSSTEIWMGEVIASVWNQTDDTYQIITYHLIVKGGSSYSLTEKYRSGDAALSGASLTCTVSTSTFYLKFSDFGGDSSDENHSVIQVFGGKMTY